MNISVKTLLMLAIFFGVYEARCTNGAMQLLAHCLVLSNLGSGMPDGGTVMHAYATQLKILNDDYYNITVEGGRWVMDCSVYRDESDSEKLACCARCEVLRREKLLMLPSEDVCAENSFCLPSRQCTRVTTGRKRRRACASIPKHVVGNMLLMAVEGIVCFWPLGNGAEGLDLAVIEEDEAAQDIAPVGLRINVRLPGRRKTLERQERKQQRKQLQRRVKQQCKAKGLLRR